jgi:radical SAM protein with 4Fe4S-binding SPASM domain
MPSGKVFPCARFGSHDKYPIADSTTGKLLPHLNIMKNPLITNPRTYNKCKECSLYTYCNAGCTFQQLQEENGILTKAEPVDSICKLLHICYGQSMRIVNELKDNDLFINMIKGAIKNVG